MLTNKQKSYLKALANQKKADYQIGKDGITENLIRGISDGLKANELLKFSLLKSCPLSVREAALDIASLTQSDIVQLIGRTCILYRHDAEGKIKLPK